MTAGSERYEVVHTETGWIARHISSNGNEVARSTNVYARKRGAVRAVELMAGGGGWSYEGDILLVPRAQGAVAEVRVLDERTTS